jgi:hypothetical protein
MEILDGLFTDMLLVLVGILIGRILEDRAQAKRKGRV